MTFQRALPTSTPRMPQTLHRLRTTLAKSTSTSAKSRCVAGENNELKPSFRRTTHAPSAFFSCAASCYLFPGSPFLRLPIQAERTARFGYMSHQTDINEKMRAILMDWLEEVHVKFKLMPETMFLTQTIIDRFLEKKIVVRSKLQLVGVTAMLIASKYEEIFAPEVRDFVYITDKAYTREQILAMEATMLNTLDFRVSSPTVFVFLNRYLKAAQADTRLTQLATFIVERQMQEYKMLQHLPSKIAASAVNIAMRTLRGRNSWSETMDFYTSYSQADLRATIIDIQDIMAGSISSTLQAVRKKHLSPKFGEVANIPLATLDA